MRDYGVSWDERAACWFCDYWWLVLLLFVVLFSGYGYYRWRNPSNSEEQALGTGDVQVTLRWQTVDDLDLWVTDPNGEAIFFNHPSSESGGQLDVDANANCVDPVSHPVENIFWPYQGAPSGHYRVEVMYYAHCRSGEETPVSFHVRVLVDGQVREFDGQVATVGEKVLIFEFDR